VTELDGIKLLVVDDNKMIRRQLAAMLRKRGALVLCAGDGLEGYELAVSNLPDVIILDAQMPVLDGCGAALRLKENKETVNIPIIMLTGTTDNDYLTRCLECGVGNILQKPTTGGDIVTAVAAVLKENP